jgi:hypothetical protein
MRFTRFDVVILTLLPTMPHYTPFNVLLLNAISSYKLSYGTKIAITNYVAIGQFTCGIEAIENMLKLLRVGSSEGQCENMTRMTCLLAVC